MPSGLIDEKDGMGSRCDGVGDFGQMQVHRLGIAGGQDQGGSLSLLRADGSEDVGRGGALIPRSARASAALSPPAGDLVLLTNARFIRPFLASSDTIPLVRNTTVPLSEPKITP